MAEPMSGWDSKFVITGPGCSIVYRKLALFVKLGGLIIAKLFIILHFVSHAIY